jgi:hypothetical protein
MPKGHYIPPKSGDAPKGVKQILKTVYERCREENPGEIKSRKRKCARISWGAVKKAGYKKVKGKWKKE